jgi:hypothetical protein
VLRETVTRASRCLDDLSTGQRRVLTLRAASRSRRGVARRLDISVRRVTRLERTGLARLRTLSARGACSAATASTTVSQASYAPPAAGSAAAVKPSGSGGDRPRRAERETSGGRDDGGGEAQGGVDTPPRSGGVAGVTQTNPAGGVDLMLPLLLLALAAVAAVFVAGLRRRTTDPVPAEAPAAPIWIPWRRSNMQGPSWNDPRPAEDSKGEWSGEREPQPPPQQHEEWTPPVRRTPTRRG